MAFEYPSNKQLYKAWDANQTTGCQCYNGYDGPDCSSSNGSPLFCVLYLFILIVLCPKGFDPLVPYTALPSFRIRTVAYPTGVSSPTFVFHFNGQSFAFSPLLWTSSHCKTLFEGLPNIDIANCSFTRVSSYTSLVDVTFEAFPVLPVENNIYRNDGDPSSFSLKCYDTEGNLGSSCDIELLSLNETFPKYSLCSNRGLCDFSVGSCSCFSAYAGSNCNYTLAGSPRNTGIALPSEIMLLNITKYPFNGTDLLLETTYFATSKFNSILMQQVGINYFELDGYGNINIFRGGLSINGRNGTIFSGQTIASGGLTVSGGLTISSGGLDMSAGPLTVVGGGSIIGGLLATGNVNITPIALIPTGGLTVNYWGVRSGGNFLLGAGGATIKTGGLTVDGSLSVASGGVFVRRRGITILNGGLVVQGGGITLQGPFNWFSVPPTSGGVTLASGGISVRGGITALDVGLAVTTAGLSIVGTGLMVTNGLTIFNSGFSITGGLTLNDFGFLLTGGLTVDQFASNGGYTVNGAATIMTSGLVVNSGGLTLDSIGLVINTGGLTVAENGLVSPDGLTVVTAGLTVTGGMSVSQGFVSNVPSFSINDGGLVITTAGLSINSFGLTGTSGLSVMDGGVSITVGGLTIQQNGFVSPTLTVNSGGIVANLGLTVSNGGIVTSQGLTVTQGGLVFSAPMSIAGNGLLATGGLSILAANGMSSSGGITVAGNDPNPPCLDDCLFPCYRSGPSICPGEYLNHFQRIDFYWRTYCARKWDGGRDRQYVRTILWIDFKCAVASKWGA